MSLYSLLDYGKMLADTVRVEAYRRALEQVIQPGCTVLEVGAGPGLFSLLACQLGAAKVWAVEPEPVISLARELVARNGFADRVELVAAPVGELTLDRPVDVLVSDLRGVLPLVGDHLPTLRDARERLLAPEGRLVAERDLLRVALVEAPDLYERFAEPWTRGIAGLDLSAGRDLAVHGWLRPTTGLPREAALAHPATWFELDYTTYEEDGARGSVELEINRPGTAHGLALWFDSQVAPGATLSNAPWLERRIYGYVFVALERPLALEATDRVVLELDATLVGGEYVWSWTTRSTRQGRQLATFRQSSFYAEPLAPRLKE